MTHIHLNKLSMETYGTVPSVGKKAPDFVLTGSDFMPIALSDFKQKIVILNVFTSIDTQTCFKSIELIKASCRTLNTDSLSHACVSMDLPYALQRSIKAHSLLDIHLLSDYRDHCFGADYGVLISSGPLAGLLARAVFIIDEQHIIRYAEMSQDLNKPCQINELTKVLSALSKNK